MNLAIKSNLDPNKLEMWIKQQSDFTLIPDNGYVRKDFANLGAPIKSGLPASVKLNINSKEKHLILIY